MFTIEQVKAAHSKVKSGADFPNYVQEIIKLGVKSYETYVTDGHTDYCADNNYAVSSAAKYAAMVIADENNTTLFKRELKAHQRGETDYMAFCKICADTGVEKWVVNMTAMTCTYFNKVGHEILVEIIPTA